MLLRGADKFAVQQLLGAAAVVDRVGFQFQYRLANLLRFAV